MVEQFQNKNGYIDRYVTTTEHNKHEPCALLALCEENPSVTDGLPSQRASIAVILEKGFIAEDSSW